MSFREKVLAIVADIPAGSVLTYKQVAILAGSPKAARAVGAIISTNYDPAIPCHRVIGSDGALRGYNRGIELKEQLLKQEKFLQ